MRVCRWNDGDIRKLLLTEGLSIIVNIIKSMQSTHFCDEYLVKI